MSSKNKILVEEIIQKFDTEELSYFKLGSISGEVNSDGKDEIDHAVTLVIPKSKIKNFFNQFKKAVEFKEEELIESKDDKDKKKEILGSPISISHPKLR
tara:strand:- start:61 stop:357 length:297 start_codon:yes stop_codon:yes gene_type:complete